MVQPLWKMVWGFSHKKRKKLELPRDPAVPLLDTHLKKAKILIWKDTYMPVCIVALFIISKEWMQPKCPSIDDKVKKM